MSAVGLDGAAISAVERLGRGNSFGSRVAAPDVVVGQEVNRFCRRSSVS